jgi:type IV secretion system protein VirD4
LPQQGDLVVTAPLTEYELGVAPDEGDAEVVQAAALNRSMQGLARAVSLDPDDKMGL